MKFNMEDPLEKRFKKPSALNERLNGLLENNSTTTTATTTAAATTSKPPPKDLSGDKTKIK
jgi:hypothetical protein